MKKALIHDWYYVSGGAEKVIKEINSIWNDFDHFALIDYLPHTDRQAVLAGKRVTTSFIQKLPGAKKNHRKYLQLFPYAIEQFNLGEYDIIISSSSSIAKGVLANHNQLHICYCHSPARYAWDLYHQYLKDSKLNSGLKAIYAKYILHKFRNWDIISSNRVDYFVANSHYVASRIHKIYNREAVVIYPPVDVDYFELYIEKDNFYITASRMVPYKRMDVIIRAFNEMPDRHLIVLGDGPEFSKLKKLAENNIEFKGFTDKQELKSYLQKAKAFVFAAEEDFGIVPVEAQSCGTPVIAYGKGGVLETVQPDLTGVFFYQQTPEAIIDAVNRFEKMSFDPQNIHNNALKFSNKQFKMQFKKFVLEKWQVHNQINNPRKI